MHALERGTWLELIKANWEIVVCRDNSGNAAGNIRREETSIKGNNIDLGFSCLLSKSSLSSTSIHSGLLISKPILPHARQKFLGVDISRIYVWGETAFFCHKEIDDELL